MIRELEEDLYSLSFNWNYSHSVRTCWNSGSFVSPQEKKKKKQQEAKWQAKSEFISIQDTCETN